MYEINKDLSWEELYDDFFEDYCLDGVQIISEHEGDKTSLVSFPVSMAAFHLMKAKGEPLQLFRSITEYNRRNEMSNFSLKEVSEDGKPFRTYSLDDILQKATECFDDDFRLTDIIKKDLKGDFESQIRGMGVRDEKARREVEAEMGYGQDRFREYSNSINNNSEER